MTSVISEQDALDSQYLSNSFSNLSKARSSNSLIVRAYKQATQLYLTKRFREALETLEPAINPATSNDNGHENGNAGLIAVGSAPVAQSSKGTRTKVWVFYLSLLHAIIDLGLEDGKATFGSTRWRQLAAKAREGTIWEEIVQRGYNGNEGDVDPEVVQNMATLLLGHMQDQKLNQQRLETWLSISGEAGPHLSYDGIDTPLPSGAATPKILNTRLKVLELYALHVLPANDEWELSQGFIELNNTLDEERRDAFQQALENLREEKEGALLREKALKEQRERELIAQRQEEEAKRAREARLDEERRKAAESERAKTRAASSSSSMKVSRDLSKSASAGRPAAKAPKRPASNSAPTFYRRATTILGNIQQLILHARTNVLGGNNTVLLQAIMFLAAFLLLLSRQDIRVKIRRIMGNSWNKVKQTVGMGVKVSYL